MNIIDKELGYDEATVKRWVKDLFREYNVYSFWPVQAGIGATGLDAHCVVKYGKLPLAFFVETKRFGKEPTERQKLFISQRLKQQGAVTWVIDGMVGVNKLRVWLEKLKKASEGDE